MRLIEKLKNKVKKAETKQATKEIIKDTGMELTDEKLTQVAGGGYVQHVPDRLK